MAIPIERLAELDPDGVTQAIATLGEAVQEDNPAIDVRRGVIGDLVVGYSGMLAAKAQEEQIRLRRSSSIAAILQDPTLADDETVDNIASNYRVSRQAGAAAGGAVMIVVSELRDLTIAAGAEFVSQGKTFATETAFTGRATATNVVAATDRLMVPRNDGFYEFQISVVAQEVGESGRLVKGASLLPQIPPLNFVQAYVASDFVSGLNAEDNAALAQRLVNGASVKTLSSRVNMSASLAEEYPAVVSDSLIGFGDVEMLRDQHSVFPGSFGGRVDWYVRTQPLYQTDGITKTATLMEIEPTSTIWEISFDRDDYPGMYDAQVLPGDVGQYAGYLETTSDLRYASLAALDNDGFLPDIAEASYEFVYTRFQTIIMRFRDTIKSTTGLSVGDTAVYNVDVRYMPGLADIQETFSDRDARNAAGDVLVKAPIPCFLAVTFVVEKEPGQLDPDTNAIADAISEFVNNYGFTGRLPASALTDIVHNNLTGKASATLIDMFGRIRRVDGTYRTIRHNELLEIPSEPSGMLSGRTVAFFLKPEDVNVSITTADLAET